MSSNRDQDSSLKQKRIRVLLVDDHQLVREGIQRMLELDEGIIVVGEAGTGEEALHQAEILSPDVVLVDVQLPDINGIEVIRQLKAKQAACHAIILTVHEDRYLSQAAEAGADGYLLKDVSRADLIRAIKAVNQGQSPLSPSVAKTLFTQFATLSKKNRENTLTKRQLDILRLIAAGVTNREIAAKLFLSEATVKRETNAIFEVLGVDDRAHAVSESYKRNLL
jgi:two-component system, NarL family, response regulator DegU